MSVKYKEFSGLNLPAIEKEILAKWKENDAFQKSVDLREGATPFVFYEGPPSANGLPGIHHVISRTLKDLVCRYKTMQGFQVKRKGGWDTHGLPVELGVEKMLGITKEDIGKKISVAEYNETCRREVLKYKDKWDEITTKMGYWVDLNHPYITFDNSYIETLWWLLKQLYEKGLLYESVSIQPYSPAAGTGLSSHELNQPGTYKIVKDTSAVAMFKAVKNKKTQFLFDAARDDEVFFLAWTTTPWTLPSNLGLTVGANIDYVLVKTFNPYTYLPVNVILAKALFTKWFAIDESDKKDINVSDLQNKSLLALEVPALLISDKEASKMLQEKGKIATWQILAEFKGKDLEGASYEQLLSYLANKTDSPNAFKVLLSDFVTTEDGTGIVHTAPAFGADDYKVGKKYNIGILTLVDREGKFVDGLGEFSNRFVKNYKDDKAYEDVNVDICVKLKKENRAFKVEKYEHTYPHCWRTDKPILYYPLDAWFIKTTAAKDRMVELNKTINWKPKSTGEGRFGNWLENMVDWNLSRSRYWGTPLPVWKTEDGKEQKCIGSIDELISEGEKAKNVLGGTVNQELSAENLDLHKPYVDEIVLVSKSGKPMRRVSDLVDVWFDSGAMPYAQLHYPFENKGLIDSHKAFPADFIAEGVDQTRGWFYTLHALGVLLFDSIAYKNVVSNGLVLDKNGNKMSKRLGNVVDPFQTIDKFGADATRWYLITNASPWDNLKFDINGIQEVQRKFFGTLYNTYQFFALYSNLDGFSFEEEYIPLEQRPEIDRWILSSLNSLIVRVTESMDDYEPTQAGRAIEEFVDELLSNWYVRLCRRRFWKGEYEHDKISAYQTLYECMETVVKLIAPISPFFSDALFQNLNNVTGRFNTESIHHTDFPKENKGAIDTGLEAKMEFVQNVCSLVLSIRKKVNIKVRQPLEKVIIPVAGDSDFIKFIFSPDISFSENTFNSKKSFVNKIIESETNVKKIELVDINDFDVSLKPIPNFKLLSTKFGKLTSQVGEIIKNWSKAEILEFNNYNFKDFYVKDGILELKGNVSFDATTVRIEKDIDVLLVAEDIPGWSFASKGSLTVALDTTISYQLKQEGEAREFVNRIQNLRKDSGFEVTDRININIVVNERLVNSINEYKNYICAEILADSIDFVPHISNGTEIEINDIPLKVSVIKKA